MDGTVRKGKFVSPTDDADDDDEYDPAEPDDEYDDGEFRSWGRRKF